MLYVREYSCYWKKDMLRQIMGKFKYPTLRHQTSMYQYSDRQKSCTFFLKMSTNSTQMLHIRPKASKCKSDTSDQNDLPSVLLKE